MYGKQPRKGACYMCAPGCGPKEDDPYMAQRGKDYGGSVRNPFSKSADNYGAEDNAILTGYEESIMLAQYSEMLPQGVERYINENPRYQSDQGMMPMQPMMSQEMMPTQQDSLTNMMAAMFVAQYMDQNNLGAYQKMVGEAMLGHLLKKSGLEARLSKPERMR